MFFLHTSFIHHTTPNKIKSAPFPLSTSTLFFFIAFHLSLVLSGCNSTSTIPYPAQDNLLPSLQTRLIIPQPLPVIAWTPRPLKQSTNNTIRIYIEGDGKAWVRRGRPSLDPTPENRLVHYLMKEDKKAEIAYLGRPCQYVQTPECHTKIWTFERYSRPVVDLMSLSVDKIKNQGNYQKVELVGYSGGATIALLLAALRDDVISVRTIAGNLTPDFTNSFHGVSEMPGSMIPLDYKKRLSRIPQVHFYGSDDVIIPDKISLHYSTRMNSTKCITVKPVTATHHSGWAEHWQELLKITPACELSDKI